MSTIDLLHEGCKHVGFESDKVMFEIYREDGYDRKYRVVYFTELDDNNKENEINRAMAGEHFFDSFFKESTIGSAKAALTQVIGRMNAGEALTAQQVKQEIEAYLA